MHLLPAVLSLHSQMHTDKLGVTMEEGVMIMRSAGTAND